MTMREDFQTNETEIKRYLYGEMNEPERARLENEFFDDDALFFAVAELENRLVDDYARGQMTGAELVRFERALKNSPPRRAKIANAAALQTFIGEERLQSAATAQEQAAQKQTARETPFAERTFGRKVAEIFKFKTPIFGYAAAAALLLLFALSSLFLLFENRRKADEIARLENNNQNANGNDAEKQLRLENQLADARKREGELKAQIDGERQTSGDLTDELERERQNRVRVETEMARLRRENTLPKPAAPTATEKAQTPVIASIFLTPTIITRGGENAANAQKFAVERGTKRIAVRLALPDDADKDGRFSVESNKKTAARDLAILISGGGQRKIVQLSVSPNDLLDGANEFVVFNAAGAPIGRYVFYMSKK